MVTTADGAGLPARKRSPEILDEHRRGLRRIASLAQPVQGDETLALAASLGRITARDLRTEAALPRFDHSAMDGFGLCAVAQRVAAPGVLAGSAACFLVPV
jgi:molybdopterin biosynthesis enzyme